MNVNNYDIIQVKHGRTGLYHDQRKFLFRDLPIIQTRSIYSNRAVDKSINPTDCSIKVYRSFSYMKPVCASAFSVIM